MDSIFNRENKPIKLLFQGPGYREVRNIGMKGTIFCLKATNSIAVFRDKVDRNDITAG